MNKTERIKHLTKSVIAFMDALDYEVVNDESGRLTFCHDGDIGDNTIDYSRSGDVAWLNWASDDTKRDGEKLEQFVEIMKQGLAL